jgi:hypothetical protein
MFSFICVDLVVDAVLGFGFYNFFSSAHCRFVSRMERRSYWSLESQKRPSAWAKTASAAFGTFRCLLFVCLFYVSFLGMVHGVGYFEVKVVLLSQCLRHVAVW